ncbi:MAG: hypothetical protein RJB09_1410 [Pseudomonadota bacterium]|jgi:hypothetical protein
MTFQIEPSPEDDVALCTCCAGAPGVRGAVNEDGAPVAVYFAEPAGMPKYPMLRLGLVVGAFKDDSLPDDRLSLAFVCRPGLSELGLEFSEPWLATFPELGELGQRLPPEEAATHAQATRFRALAAAVIAGDERLAPMRGGAPKRHGFTADSPSTDA